MQNRSERIERQERSERRENLPSPAVVDYRFCSSVFKILLCSNDLTSLDDDLRYHAERVIGWGV